VPELFRAVVTLTHHAMPESHRTYRWTDKVTTTIHGPFDDVTHAIAAADRAAARAAWENRWNTYHSNPARRQSVTSVIECSPVTWTTWEPSPDTPPAGPGPDVPDGIR
jgi:hypothetical protein